MKLRNKKTGEIRELIVREDDAKLYDDSGVFYKMVGSLAELNTEWEDYKSKEPLIEDERIRNIVREWANINCFKYLKSSIFVGGTRFISGIFFIEFCGIFIYLNENKEYTIAELCGEEE